MTSGSAPVPTIPTSVLLAQLWSRILPSGSFAGLMLGPIAGLLIWGMPLHLEPTVHLAFAVSAFMVVSWVVGAIEYGITALSGCLLFWALHVTPFDVAFSGFVSPAPWFVFGALLVGQAVMRTGLAKRLGYLLIQRVGLSYGRLLFGLLVITLLMQFIVPSQNAQIVILAPLAMALITAFDAKPYSNVATGLFLGVLMAVGFLSRMFMVGGPAILARGIIEQQTGAQLFWSQWAIGFLPLTLLTLGICWAVVYWLYPPEKSSLPGGRAYVDQVLQEMGRWSREELKTLLWIVLAITLWATDFLHHVDPALIGIGIGLLLAVPKLGVLDTSAIKSVNFPLVLFLGGALSLSKIMVVTDSLPLLINGISRQIAPLLAESWSGSLTLYLSGICYRFVTNTFAMVGTGLPVWLGIATEQNLNPIAVGLIWNFATSSQLFIYQASFVILAYSYGYFKASALFKTGAIMALVGGLYIMVLVPFYWPLVGLSWKTAPSFQVQAAPAAGKKLPLQSPIGKHELNGQPEQAPVLASGSTTAEATPPVARRLALDPATEAWRAVRDSNDYRDFAAFLETFPRSRFNFVARMRLKQFALQPSSVAAPTVINGWAPLSNGQPSSLTPQLQVRPRTASLHVSASFSPMMQYTQRRLQTMGIDPGPIDGVYGPRTAAALRLFQKKRGLTVTGRLDAATQKVLWAATPKVLSQNKQYR